MDTYLFGEKIRQARLRKGISQHDLASMLGTGRRFVSELESGKPTIELGKALRAAELLKVNINSNSSVDLPKLISSMEKPRLWSARKNATPRMLFADVIKNPSDHDLEKVAGVYGVEHLKRMRNRLIRVKDISPMAARESARILNKLESNAS